MGHHCFVCLLRGAGWPKSFAMRRDWRTVYVVKYLLRYLFRREIAYLMIAATGAILYANFGPHLGATHHKAPPTPTPHAVQGIIK